MQIAITGEKGFIGIHLTQYFKNILKYEVVELGRDYLNQLQKAKKIDWLIHGACVHRHEDSGTLISLNQKLTNDTLQCLIKNNIQCNIVFLSSIQEELNTPYGQSKRETKKLLSEYCKSINKEFISFKLPNIFGQYAVPNKTSFIATFCYNFHNGLQIDYNKNEIKLVSINDILPIITKFKFCEIKYKRITVEKVYRLLKFFHEITLNGEFPQLKNKFELDLYQTYLSYINYKI